MIIRLSVVFVGFIVLAGCSTGAADFDGPPNAVAQALKECQTKAENTPHWMGNIYSTAGAEHRLTVDCMKERGYRPRGFEIR